ncbi:MAG: prolyl oligopeptidase family serine peptidase [Myxococcota bacterium]|nr:prolyl oligopeptidase family serine peptidase [Myxococcota bacterium]
MAQNGQKDPFQWLEGVDDPKALDWVKKQNEITLKELKGDPRYQDFLEKTTAILTATDRIAYGALRGDYVYNFWQDKVHVRGIWRRTTLASYQTENPSWETLLDFDELAKKEKKNWVFKGSKCLPPDHSRCMISLSDGGKDAVTIREFDVDMRAFVKDGFSVPEAKTAAAWVDINTLLIGTDWGPGSLTQSGYPRVVKRWTRGTRLNDAETVFEGESKDVGVWPWVSHRPEGATEMVYRGTTFFTSELHFVPQGVEPTKLPVPPSAKAHGVFKDVFLISLRKQWAVRGETYQAGTLLALEYAPLKTGKLGHISRLYEPDDRASIASVSMTKNDVYVAVLDTVKGTLFRQEKRGQSWIQTQVQLPKNGAVRVTSSDAFQDTIFVNFEDFITPDALMAVSRDAKPRKLKTLPSRFDNRGVRVEQRFAKSADGTEIPYFLVFGAGHKADESTPTLLYGYGGFEISLTPRYMASVGKLWLERGGAFAMANIRGGGEFGPKWHAAAKKENRQRAFDDFIAVAEDLIKTKVTTSAQLGIMGGSNGGLLVGATVTQRPELFNAVVCQVPLLDMMRYTKLLAGASWAAEYGDPTDPKMASVIRKYSPYHNLSSSKNYPKIFFVTSTRDDRVHPGHARKMAAKMLSLNKDVYYYENIDGGHAASANQNQRAERTALEYIYLSKQLGLK